MDLTDHARRDAIQTCVLLVSARYGNEAGTWLLGQMLQFELTTRVMAAIAGRAHCEQCGAVKWHGDGK